MNGHVVSDIQTVEPKVRVCMSIQHGREYCESTCDTNECKRSYLSKILDITYTTTD